MQHKIALFHTGYKVHYAAGPEWIRFKTGLPQSKIAGNGDKIKREAMNLKLSAQHLGTSASIRRLIEEKIRKLKTHFDRVVDIHVNLKIEKLDHIAEATIRVRGHTFFALSSAQDMYVAIDQTIDKLDRQLVRHKEKLKSHHEKEMEHHNLRK